MERIINNPGFQHLAENVFLNLNYEDLKKCRMINQSVIQIIGNLFKNMENIINNPGLQHLAEKIFLNLNYEDLQECQLINQSTSHILNNPMFWITKLIHSGLSKKYQKDWIDAIQSEMNSKKKKHISAYLKWHLKNQNFNFPCYRKFKAKILENII